MLIGLIICKTRGSRSFLNNYFAYFRSQGHFIQQMSRYLENYKDAGLN